MKPPAYVSIVLSPDIRLESLDRAARDSIGRAGLDLRRDGLFHRSVRFDAGQADLLANEEFVRAMVRLNEAGVAFCEDHRQGWAPADIMRELQANGRIAAPFTAIAWRGPGDWFTTVVRPPQPPAMPKPG